MLFPGSVRRKIVSMTSHPAPWLNADFAESHGIVSARLTASEGSWWWLPSARDWYQTRARIAGILTNFHPTFDERRYPYLDQALTEFLASIPVEQLLRPGDRRSLMRRAMKKILPLEVLSRRSKQQESRGYVMTLRKHSTQVQAILDAPLTSELGYVRAPEFRTAFAALGNGLVSNESMMLLRGLFLELWIRSALEHNILATRGQSWGQARKAKPSVFNLSASRSAYIAERR
jgi:asparagine synthase (glutamine-hydrolysing)